MSVLWIVVAVVGILLVALLGYAATRPDTFSLQRSIEIQAPAESIFPLINNLQAHEAWSPFDAPDPATTKTHSGASEGAGAVYEWSGKGRSGTGRLSIRQSEPPSRIVMQLDMLAPMKASNEVVFTLVPAAHGTRVTWAMQGHVPYPVKVVHILLNMDRMVGGQFDAGLRTLKGIVERNR